jgi:2-oxoglutarate ferredoxin oxidoreductase subunit alpha
MTPPAADRPTARTRRRRRVERVTIRFAGDSGDGIQVVGGEFASATAAAGNDLATFPDYPAEIRAPAGSIPGVSGFQIQFSSGEVHTPGDRPDVLVAFNPAALKVNLGDLPPNAVIVVNRDAFEEIDLRKAGFAKDPLEDGSLSAFQVFKVPITTLTLKALDSISFAEKDRLKKERCKNYFALGMLYWFYSRPLETTLRAIERQFSRRAEGDLLVKANQTALRAGHAYAEASEAFRSPFEVPPAKVSPGWYRNVSGNEALAMGLVAASRLAGLPLFYGSYPITPASEILHELAKHKNFDVRTFQAEDEIAAVTSAIGASFAGALGVTGTSGPGLALKSEAIGLAVMAELPLVVVDVQRSGPSTGMPTRTDQGDLLQALFGRSSESPVCVVAPQSPADGFDMALFAARTAIKYRVPVIILSDGILAQGAEPWRIPEAGDLPPIEVGFCKDPQGFAPYRRDETTLAREWAIPGTPGLEHRIGGLEKSHIRGEISYDAENHDFMCRIRAAKVRRIVQDVPDVEVHGPDDASTLVVGWGSTYGAIRAAVEECRAKGLKVARAHLRHLNPLPANLGRVLSRFGKVLVPELNLGQLLLVLRAKYLVDARGLNKVEGRPFRIAELVDAVEREVR